MLSDCEIDALASGPGPRTGDLVLGVGRAPIAHRVRAGTLRHREGLTCPGAVHDHVTGTRPV